MINLQWGFNPIIIRMLFTVTLFQQGQCEYMKSDRSSRSSLYEENKALGKPMIL
jgi:hypothetical protein